MKGPKHSQIEPGRSCGRIRLRKRRSPKERVQSSPSGVAAISTATGTASAAGGNPNTRAIHRPGAVSAPSTAASPTRRRVPRSACTRRTAAGKDSKIEPSEAATNGSRPPRSTWTRVVMR